MFLQYLHHASPTTAPQGVQPPREVQAKNAQGFTVIELLVALSIMIILISVATNTLGELGPKFALDNTVRSVGMTLNQARSQAITMGHTIDVAFGTHDYMITDVTDGGTILSEDQFSSIIAVSSGSVVTFTPLGMSTAEVPITVSNDSYSRVVTVKITGEIILQ